MFHRYAVSLGASYHSIDQPGKWHVHHIEFMQRLGYDTENYHTAQIVGDYYALPQDAFAGQTFDLILIDGPWKSRYRATPTAIDFVLGHSNPWTTFVVDDAQRPGETRLGEAIANLHSGHHQHSVMDSRFRYRRTDFYTPNGDTTGTAKSCLAGSSPSLVSLDALRNA